jgi:hypothetical protein
MACVASGAMTAVKLAAGKQSHAKLHDKFKFAERFAARLMVIKASAAHP